MGYVNQDEETQKYYMTLKIANISEKVLQQVDILSICPPYLNRLAEYAGETVHLVKRTGTNVSEILETSRFVAKTQYTIRNKEQLFHELKQIKAQCYSLDNHELSQKICPLKKAH